VKKKPVLEKIILSWDGTQWQAKPSYAYAPDVYPVAYGDTNPAALVVTKDLPDPEEFS